MEDRTKLKRLAEEAIEKGDLDRAMTLLLREKDVVLKDPDLLSMIAVIQIMQGNWSAAKRFLMQVLSVFPLHGDLLFNLAYLYDQEGDCRTAQRLLELAKSSAKGEAFVDVEAALARISRPQVRKPKIALAYTSYSGSNTVALYKLTPKHLRERYELDLVRYAADFEFQAKVMGSDLVVTTHAQSRLYPCQPNLELWHGVPLKALGLMDWQEDHAMMQTSWMKHTDCIASYSTFYNTLINATIGKTIDKYAITGAPRNDFLFVSKGRELLADILEVDLSGKRIVFFMPTFRQRTLTAVDGGVTLDNLQQLGIWDDAFRQFCEEKHCLFVLKLHPHEEAWALDQLRRRDLGMSVCILQEKELEKNETDLYEVLNAADVLVTDYSSVYFDYLLLDRPMVFAGLDYEEYRASRGFLLEPYERWTPGPHVSDRDQFRHELAVCLEDSNYYRNERSWIADIVHKYKDGSSTARVWQVIERMLPHQDS